jgi:hypothetical protein
LSRSTSPLASLLFLFLEIASSPLPSSIPSTSSAASCQLLGEGGQPPGRRVLLRELRCSIFRKNLERCQRSRAADKEGGSRKLPRGLVLQNVIGAHDLLLPLRRRRRQQG